MSIEYIGKTLFIDKKILVIGDLHLGYVGSMREAGYLVPGGLYAEIIEELDKVFERINNDRNERGDNKSVEKVVLLGDLKHEFGTVLKEEWTEVLNFMDYLSARCDEIIIVKGNHDAIIDNVLKHKESASVNYYLWSGFAFLHGDRDFPEIHGNDIKTWVVGHGHPAVVLKENIGVKKEKYKCFLSGRHEGRRIIILPSFFPLNDGTDVRSYDLNLAWDFKLNNFEVAVVGENLESLDFGKVRYI